MQAEKNPATFRDHAAAIGVDPEPNTGAVSSTQQSSDALIITAALAAILQVCSSV